MCEHFKQNEFVGVFIAFVVWKLHIPVHDIMLFQRNAKPSIKLSALNQWFISDRWNKKNKPVEENLKEKKNKKAKSLQ